MGTGPFAVPSSEALRSAGHEIPLMVTRPSTTMSAKKAPPRPMFEWAAQRQIPTFEPQSINTVESVEALASYRADLFFVCDYGQILSKSCLSASRLGGINLHGSILPRHRGAAPVQWSLLAGDSTAGVTAILMTPKLDAGPALAIRSTPILPDETAAELEPRLARLGVEATLEAVRQLEDWDSTSPIGQLQDNSQATRAPRFDKQHGQLDFRLPAEYLVRLIRATQPWPGAYGDFQVSPNKQIRLLIRSARSIDIDPRNGIDLFSPDALPGEARLVCSLDLALDWPAPWRELLAVHSSKGVLFIGTVQPAGKREMSVAEFVRGHPLGKGSRFLLPQEPAQQLMVSLNRPA